jgi:ribonuclease HI
VKLRIYTDGGCEPNPGQGSWAFVILGEKDDIIFEDTGFEEIATCNRMEYTALVKALETAKNIPNISDIQVFSDSKLLVNTFSKWMDLWESKNWIRKNNDEIKNLDLVKQLYSLKKNLHFKVNISWVKGHDGDKWNEYCDRKCKEVLEGKGVEFSNSYLRDILFKKKYKIEKHDWTDEDVSLSLSLFFNKFPLSFDLIELHQILGYKKIDAKKMLSLCEAITNPIYVNMEGGEYICFRIGAERKKIL